MLLGNVFQQLYNMVDSVIVGKYVGKEALAAVGASFPIIYVMIAFVIGIGSGASVVISQYYGAKQIDKVKRAVDTTYIMLFVASIFTTFLGIFFGEDVLRLTKLPDEVIPMAKTYLVVYFSGMIVFFGYNGTSSVLRGLGDSKTPLYFMIISTFVNIGLDLLFIVQFEMGVMGAALATVIAQTVALIAAIIYLNRTHKIIQISLLKMKYDTEILLQSIKIGLPTGIQQTLVALGFIALFAIVNRFGTDVIAAYSAASRLDSLASLPAMNFAAALAAFTGQNMGANRPDRVKKGLYSTFFMTSVIALVVTAIIVLFGDSLMTMFTSDENVIRIGREYLVIVSSFYIVFSAMFVMFGMLRGAGAAMVAMYITLLSLWVVRLPVAYFLSNKIGETGIWYAMPIAWCIGLTAGYIYYRVGNWQKYVVTKKA